MNSTRDVVVIGAGPVGSTTATPLADRGHRVLILERETFPRYHIGKSLLPFNFHPLQRLGLDQRLRQSHFVKKYSVKFLSPSGRVLHPFNFGTRIREDIAQTWQVLRSEFDQMLMGNAKAKGAEVVEQLTVLDLLKSGDTVIGIKGGDHHDGSPAVLVPEDPGKAIKRHTSTRLVTGRQTRLHALENRVSSVWAEPAQSVG